MKKQIVLFGVLFVLFLTSCSPAATPTPTPDLRATETRIAANIFATQTASVPTATSTLTATSTSVATPTPARTATPTIRNTSTRTPLPRNTPIPTARPTSVVQDKTVKLLDKWEITLVSVRRDKTIFGYFGAETAFGVWATVMFRTRNLQGGSDYIGKSFGIWLSADGKRAEHSILNTVEDKAQYFYACCESAFHMLGPGEETVVLYSVDVPENSKTLEINFTVASVPVYPRFLFQNFDQVPARKTK